MIQIDIEMPKKCISCPLLGKDAMYCTVYPRKDLSIFTVATGKPEWCPLHEMEDK